MNNDMINDEKNNQPYKNNIPDDGIGICQYNENDNTFTLIDGKGKQYPGGFVVMIEEGEDEEGKKSKKDESRMDVDDLAKEEMMEKETGLDKEEVGGKGKDKKEKPKIQPKEQLFIEEVLFQQERGLLRVFVNSSHNNKKEEELSTKDLYNLLPKCNVGLASYLVYAYLKSQTYVVLRHTKERLKIVLDIQQEANALLSNAPANAEEKDVHGVKNNASPTTSSVTEKENLTKKEESNGSESNINDSNDQSDTKKEQIKISPNENKTNNINEIVNGNADKKNTTNQSSSSLWRKRKKSQSIRSLTQQLRANASHAPPPSSTILLSSEEKEEPTIAYDVYNPNSNFRKSNPGPPNFYVSITPYTTPSPTFDVLQSLLKDSCCGIPLRIATVADDGCVIMFGLTDYGVPSLSYC